MHIHYTVCDIILTILQFNPFLYGTQIVAQMQLTGWLYAREDFTWKLLILKKVENLFSNFHKNSLILPPHPSF